MSHLSHKIDFAVILQVKRANPNGDPLNGNRPRTDYNGLGEITDVCLKRKIRDRLQEAGLEIFVQSDDRKNDDATSLRDRAEKTFGKDFGKDKAKSIKQACAKWIDVRAFGQLFPYKGNTRSGKAKGAKSPEGGEENADKAVSIPIRGPVTVQSAFTAQPVEIVSTQITKSVNSEGDGTKRGADTMGMKHRIEDAVYTFYGCMNPQLAERTGFTDDDAAAIKAVLPKLFENDASSARPEGSMEVVNVIWWRHNSRAGQFPSAKVHRTLSVQPSGQFTLTNLNGLEPEIIDGF